MHDESSRLTASAGVSASGSVASKNRSAKQAVGRRTRHHIEMTGGTGVFGVSGGLRKCQSVAFS